ncbi:hypothetical protein NL676_015421 [Syzygium grande]|nr:hypothetical protein NL676_015421 [Syzygium grande]
MTEGPDLESPPCGPSSGFLWLGWAQIDGSSHGHEPCVHESKVQLQHSEHIGRNPVLKTYRELPIVCGTGVFQLVSGIATTKTYFLNSPLADAVVEYNLIAGRY